MPYIPHSDEDREAMLSAIGVRSIQDLFEDVPERVRFPELDLPPALSELEVRWELESLAGANFTTGDCPCFLGAGAYHHFVPAVVDSVLSRGEFYTAYTPYQPEVSQGTLQAIFEYQTMICALTGMETSNASHYDGATATAEAVITAINVRRMKRRKVILSPWVHPEYRAVVRTYTQGMGLTIVGDDDPQAGLPDLVGQVDKETACLIVQTPNFLGQIEELQGLAEAVHEQKALLVVVADPIALGLLKPPGVFGADIVVGEGQGLGAGPNQGLVALAAAVYMAALGRCGMRQVAELCYHKAHYAADQVDALEGYTVLRDRPFFKEFVVRCPRPVEEINDYLLEEWGIVGGYDLGRDYAHLENHMLLCVTEMNPRKEIDALVEALGEVAE